MLCYQACLSSLIARNEKENPSTDFVTRSALRGLKPRRSLGSLNYSTLADDLARLTILLSQIA